MVARTELPGNVQTVNLAASLALDPARVPGSLLLPVGSAVRKERGDRSAQSLFGLVRNTVEAPADGTLESVSTVTGQLILREPPIPVEVNAYVRGVVGEVLAGEGVVVETEAAFLQGIFGVGGETWGEITPVVDDPGQELTEARLKPEHRGGRGGRRVRLVRHPDACARAGRRRGGGRRLRRPAICASCSAAISASRSPAPRSSASRWC